MSAAQLLGAVSLDLSEGDARIARHGYERAHLDIKRLCGAVEEGKGDAARHAKCLPGLKMAARFLETRLKDTKT